MYISALAAPFTINTMPEATLLAFRDHGEVGELMRTKARSAKQILASFAKVGINHETLAAELQREGAESFDKSWKSLLASITSKHEKLTASGK